MAGYAQYRTCAICQKVYSRSNRLRIWTVRNFGKRDGWVKEDLKVCNFCMNQSQSSRVLMIASMKPDRKRA